MLIEPCELHLLLHAEYQQVSNALQILDTGACTKMLYCVMPAELLQRLQKLCDVNGNALYSVF